MTLHMETTKVAAEKTAREITELLARAGVSAVQTEYKEKKVVAMSFKCEVGGEEIPFRLPVRSDSLFTYFQNKRDGWKRADRAEKDREQAERVAWRQIFRWIQAQLALIETGMVKVQEVFLPYIQTGIGETLYDRLESSDFKALPAPEKGESDA